MSLEESIERVRAALIKKMGRRAYLRPAGLIDALAEESGETVLTVRQAMGRLKKEAWLDGVSADGTPFRQVRIVGKLPEALPDPDLERWLAVLAGGGIADADRTALTPLSIKLAGFDASEMRHILAGLLKLRDNLADETGRHRYLVSARYLLGSSKLLDALSGSALRALGIAVDTFPSHPLYVVVAGPPDPEAVILVENPAAFELAVTTSSVARCAFVSTFGFGLSKTQEDYGNQLASMVEDRFNNTITLTREGSLCPTARNLLQYPRITFWGDLDPAGVQIYLRLKQRVPQLELSALYQPMSALVNDPRHSHPYVVPTGKPGQTGMHVNCPDHEEKARWLLGLCQNRGVDQEAVSLQDIGHYAGKAL